MEVDASAAHRGLQTFRKSQIMNNLRRTFGDRVRMQREALELSKSGLATALHVDKQNIGKWELGAIPAVVSVIKLASFFGVSVDYMLGLTSLESIPESVSTKSEFMNEFTEAQQVRINNLISTFKRI